MSLPLDTAIRSLASSMGADFFGVADLGPARDFIFRQGGDRIARYSIAVAIGIRLSDDLVDLLPEQDQEGAILYRHNCYEVTNQVLDQIAVRLAGVLQREGSHAFPVPASRRTDDGEIRSVFSHKLAAHLAGLGWIGKSCLLVTPDHGPRVRWVSVLTDAPLTPSGSPMNTRCGDCTACVDICPQHAFTGRMFNPEEPREARFDVAACDRYFAELQQSGGVAVCGLCLYVCPYGKKKEETRSDNKRR
ncbi:MAG TPA: 4Fe-4S double cluster binding domain-containing protein [Methanolinea sp.]|nr:4Fe-4S double cluster binding domain-containing protein [Methanolinea sp.]HQK55830.1 4Fe-4S double cluster binding domain-containing protein [Methanolinea sp.]